MGFLSFHKNISPNSCILKIYDISLHHQTIKTTYQMKPEEFVKEVVIEDKDGVQWIVADIKPDGKVYCIRYDEVCDFDSDSFWAIECRLVSIPKSHVENIVTHFTSLGFTQDCVIEDIIFMYRLNIYVRINKDSIVRIYDGIIKVYEGQILSFMFLKLLIENLGL